MAQVLKAHLSQAPLDRRGGAKKEHFTSRCRIVPPPPSPGTGFRTGANLSSRPDRKVFKLRGRAPASAGSRPRARGEQEELSGQAPTENPARGLVGTPNRDSYRGSLSLRGCLPVGIHLRCVVYLAPIPVWDWGASRGGLQRPRGRRGGPEAPRGLRSSTTSYGDLPVFSAQETPGIAWTEVGRP